MQKEHIPKMSRKDKLILNLAVSPLARDTNKSLDAVSKLNHKYPDSYVIKKSLANLFLEAGNYQESTKFYFLSFMKQKEPSDLIKLLVSSLISGHFHLFFIDFKISFFLAKSTHVQDGDKRSLLDGLIGIFRTKEYILDLESRFNEKYIVDLSVVNFCNVDYCDRFSQQYTKCITILQNKDNKRRLADLFEILEEVFKTRSTTEAITFLIENEWLEILYYLKKEHSFFVKYYDDCLRLMSQRMLGVLPLIIKCRSENEILNFCENFRDKRPFNSVKIRDI